MTFYPDLTAYSYRRHRAFANVQTVGWLDRDYSFPRGEVFDSVLEKLRTIMLGSQIVDARVNQTRGIHPCGFCGADEFEDTDFYERLNVGSVEIWIPNCAGGFFASPSMIIHYIREHKYLPPSPFLTSVTGFDMMTPYNAQKEYERISAQLWDS
jgi:hypothetical protein